MKFIVIILLAVLAWRLIMGRWPWERKLPRVGGSFERAGARALLGVEPSASRRDILDAHRRLIATVHPDRGGSSESVHEANTARDILLAELADDSQEPR
jgi:DnaJ homolog subfamily C member 19